MKALYVIFCFCFHSKQKPSKQVKISLSNLFNYFSVSGDSKQKKIPTKKWYFDHNSGGRPLCGGHHPKVPLF